MNMAIFDLCRSYLGGGLHFPVSGVSMVHVHALVVGEVCMEVAKLHGNTLACFVFCVCLSSGFWTSLDAKSD